MTSIFPGDLHPVIRTTARVSFQVIEASPKLGPILFWKNPVFRPLAVLMLASV
jgi:hypothetical protein